LKDEDKGTEKYVSWSKECSDLASVRSAPGLWIEGAAPVVVFDTALLKVLNEAEVNVMLAHELGHYFRAHTSTLFGFIPYFFEQTNENELRRPKPTEKFKELRESLLRSQFLLTDVVPKARFGLNFASSMSNAITTVFINACVEKSPCEKPLNQLNLIFRSPEFESLLESIRESTVTEGNKATYLRFESQFIETAKILGTMPLSRDSVVEAEMRPYFDDVKEPILILDWLTAAAERVNADLKAMPENFAEAARLGLGVYTMEEEADEIAVELVARSQIGREQAVETWFTAKKTILGQLSSSDTYDDCRQLQKNSWKKAKALGVLLGAILEPHHSFCYRAYNFDREWRAHNFDRVKAFEPAFKFDPKLWASLQSSLSEMDLTGKAQKLK
jgi:hypothetical protein